MSFLSQYRDSLSPEPPKPQAPKDIFELDFDTNESAHWGSSDSAAVQDSPDLQRVLALPRRQRPDARAIELLRDRMTAKYGKNRGGVPCNCGHYRPHLVAAGVDPCAKRLTADQAWALFEMERTGGLAAAISVGGGKTLLDLLAAMAIPNVRCAVLLVPADLRVQLNHDWDYYAQHWELPNRPGSAFMVPGRAWLHVYAYSELSGPKSSALLENIKPDLLILDEGHNLRHFTASRTKRYRVYMGKHPETREVVWSGTLTKDSLKDYAHLVAYALKHGAPVPLKWSAIEEWAAALDPQPNPLIPPAPPGALRLLTPGIAEPSQAQLWAGFQKRLSETPGVVLSTNEQSCNASIVMEERKLSCAVPPEVDAKLEKIRADWERPDGEPLKEAIERARCLRQMACGFYYVWKWPKKASDDLIKRWLAARKAYFKDVRTKLQTSRMFMDSEKLVRAAAIRFYDGYKGDLPVWKCETWPAWRDVKAEFLKTTGLKKPETTPIWVDDFLVEDVVKWHDKYKSKGIIWVEHRAVGHKLAGLTGAPLFAGGPEADKAILALTGKQTIIATVKSCGTGKNLQMFDKMLMMCPPSDGGMWDQVIGREHRRGQTSDEVRVFVYRHTPEMIDSLDRAINKSSYIEGTMAGSQKLLRATYLFERK